MALARCELLSVGAGGLVATFSTQDVYIQVATPP